MYDVAVIGLGAIGSSAAATLAERGLSVLGLDRFHPPHSMGSSHGGTRVIREAYYRNSLYQPLVEAAFRSWRDLEARTGTHLMTPTGALMIGPPDGRVFAGSLGSARDHHLGYEVMTPAEVSGRFPAFHMAKGTLAVFEPAAGILDIDACLEATLSIASAAGAELRFDEPAEGWSASADGVRVQTARAVYRARRVVLAAGAWTEKLSGDLVLPLEVERTIQFWFEPAETGDPSRLDLGTCPVWVWEYDDREEWYGFPRSGGPVKTGIHLKAGRTTDADTIDRDVAPVEKDDMRDLIRRFLPDAAGECTGADVCMYTSTPDRRFVLDRHPAHPEVVLFAGGSGHAFKFCRVLGELLADLTTDTDPAFDLAPFRATRF
ncbi:MAG: N-methyl-L-tryptophan oxidase [Gemmatimonadota bacterium]